MEQLKLKNATTTFVCGLLSLLLAGCYGIVGLILGIVALNVSKADKLALEQNPTGYSNAGLHKAGRILAIIGLVCSGIMLLYVIFVFAFIGSIFSIL